MAELAKKLHFLKSGTEQTAKAYSTTDEVGDNYIPNKIDGVACYIPIGSTSDAMATNGRVVKGGTTYAIKSQAKPAYTEVEYTTVGTHTFTVPAGVNRIRVAVCGGGGGGCLIADDDNNDDLLDYSASAGGKSAFGSLISANGGGGGRARLRYWDEIASDGERYQWDYCEGAGGSAGSPNGRAGGHISSVKPYKGIYNGPVGYEVGNKTNSDIGARTSTPGAGFGLSFSSISGDYGRGGYGTGNLKVSKYSGNGFYFNLGRMSNGAGGSGGYNSGYFNVSPGDTYSITVGAGATTTAPYWDNSGTSYTTYNANSGFVLVAYGGDI